MLRRVEGREGREKGRGREGLEGARGTCVAQINEWKLKIWIKLIQLWNNKNLKQIFKKERIETNEAEKNNQWGQKNIGKGENLESRRQKGRAGGSVEHK